MSRANRHLRRETDRFSPSFEYKRDVIAPVAWGAWKTAKAMSDKCYTMSLSLTTVANYPAFFFFEITTLEGGVRRLTLPGLYIFTFYRDKVIKERQINAALTLIDRGLYPFSVRGQGRPALEFNPKKTRRTL